MTDSQRAEIHRLLERQREAALANPQAARDSLMRSGLYNEDGSLKAAYGGKRKTAN
jgi:hypothetical protein